MADPPRDDLPNGGGAPDAAADSRARREREAKRVQELIDFGEGRLDVPVLDAAGIADILRSSHRIAMIGASSNPARPSNDVFGYLRHAGYEVVPVSPTETEVDGVTAYPTLADAVAATGPFDIVDVFRRAEFCPDHAREAVAAGASCLWLQLGIVSAEAARIALDGGLSVVMDRCTKIEVARLGR
ncbi:MAG: CoA-binding protein [Chloroflexi bacterium]|nr:CoA-binding protein [Chloroflexota bacterium]